jgi:hypothetical protein
VLRVCIIIIVTAQTAEHICGTLCKGKQRKKEWEGFEGGTIMFISGSCRLRDFSVQVYQCDASLLHELLQTAHVAARARNCCLLALHSERCKL